MPFNLHLPNPALNSLIHTSKSEDSGSGTLSNQVFHLFLNDKILTLLNVSVRVQSGDRNSTEKI